MQQDILKQISILKARMPHQLDMLKWTYLPNEKAKPPILKNAQTRNVEMNNRKYYK